MDLSLLKNFFEASAQVQAALNKNWVRFQSDTAFALYKTIATKSQPNIDSEMIRTFIQSFNWQVSFMTCN